jgi:hypothetical protein
MNALILTGQKTVFDNLPMRTISLKTKTTTSEVTATKDSPLTLGPCTKSNRTKWPLYINRFQPAITPIAIATIARTKMRANAFQTVLLDGVGTFDVPLDSSRFLIKIASKDLF